MYAVSLQLFGQLHTLPLQQILRGWNFIVCSASACCSVPSTYKHRADESHEPALDFNI